MPSPDKHPFILLLSTWKTHIVFWLGAIFVGLSSVALTVGSEYMSELFRKLHQEYLLYSFLFTPICLTLLAWITLTFFPGSERSGVPQVKAALQSAQTGGEKPLLSFRIIVGKLLLSIGGIFSGASVGLGGPAIHIGAAFMTYFGRFANFGPHYLERGLILAGSSAGFAAIFSAPLAGIVFAIEEMGRSLEEKTSGLILTAVIFAGATAIIMLGQYVYFADHSVSFPWGKAWFIIPICGIVTGFMGGLFSLILLKGGAFLKSIRYLSPLKIAFICGVILAILNYFTDGATAGTGYQETKNYLLQADSMSAEYPLMRMLATIATFFVGIPAGIFVPSLSVGAGIGANLGEWLPIAPISVVILLGMTGYFAGMLQSPLTSFVIIMEMTNTHDLLLPMMATAFIANGTSKLICPLSLYEGLTQTYLTKTHDKR
ncbi:MAG: chloride channel protein [Cycloclasticus sp. symbiont of Bathymodiolus heckerae]|nr:MAG: chloride channel protein [Cycloclasticus sp. symbiont of Bathymodiolus heckerae]